MCVCVEAVKHLLVCLYSDVLFLYGNTSTVTIQVECCVCVCVCVCVLGGGWVVDTTVTKTMYIVHISMT